jgi:ribosomal protein L3 glutamine methyltransferase
MRHTNENGQMNIERSGSQRDTVADLIRRAERELKKAGVVCAHGTDNCRDEAAAIIYHLLQLDRADPDADRGGVSQAERERCEELIRRRIETRMPAAYLLGEAWFAGLPFHVDCRVLVPRSPFAELVAGQFAPWLRPLPQPRILEIGTGSGCIAVACAVAFPGATVLATDVSAAALQVAALNVRRHRVEDRVRLLVADLFAGVTGPFDLIVSNPPYVPARDLENMPPEFAREPRSALAGGTDGLDFARRIVAGAGAHLAPDGILAVEVGGGQQALEAAFPDIPFIWPDFRFGGDGIAVVAAGDLPRQNVASGQPAR